MLMIKMDPKERKEFFKKQLKLEELIIEAGNNASQEVANVMVKELIVGITTDSYKHSSMLKALIGLHDKASLIDEKITKKLQKALEDHINLEKEAIITYKELLDKLEDEREKLVIEAILTDERRHHDLLIKIQRKVVEKYTFTQKDYWAWADVEWGGGT